MNPDALPCLLMLSDTAGIESLEVSGELRPVALRPDQRNIDQIAVLDADTGLISHIVLLNGERPFSAVFDESFTYYQPNVATVIDLCDPIEIDPEHRTSFREVNGVAHCRHHELVTIYDWDELEEVAADPDTDTTLWLCTEIEDQLILNRRDIRVEATLRHFRGDGGDSLAMSQEHLCQTRLTMETEEFEALPGNWASACESEEQAASLLALLNSVHTCGLDKNSAALAAEHGYSMPEEEKLPHKQALLSDGMKQLLDDEIQFGEEGDL